MLDSESLFHRVHVLGKEEEKKLFPWIFFPSCHSFRCKAQYCLVRSFLFEELKTYLLACSYSKSSDLNLLGKGPKVNPSLPQTFLR